MPDEHATNPPKYQLIHADDLDNLPPVQYLPATHLAAGGLNIVFGPPGSFKSFYVLGEVMQVAQATPAVYVAPEGSRGFGIRKDAWKEYHALPAGQLHFICREVNLLSTEEELKEFARAIHPVHPKVIVFDTYARCLVGGDENSARDTGLAILNCSRLQQWFKAAVILVHHTNASEARERGSTALRGAADVMIELNVQDGDQVRVSSSKVKDDAPFVAERYRFWPVAKSGVLLPADLVPAVNRVSESGVLILDTLRNPIFRKPGATCLQLHKITKLSESTIYKLLGEMKLKSLISHRSKGEPYTITSAGEDVLRAQLSPSAQAANPVEEHDLDDELSISDETLM